MTVALIIIVILVAAAASAARSSDRRFKSQELNRLTDSRSIEECAPQEDPIAWLKARLTRGDLFEQMRKRSEEEKLKRFLEAGLESEEVQERYLLIRGVFIACGPVLGAIAYLYIPAYYATILTLVSTAAGILIPMVWLNARITERSEDIQRELPLLLDLTNLGTSAGWDLGTSLERVVEALSDEFPDHPLMKEFRRALWLTASGYTWDEALARVADRLDHDVVRRTTMALTQALKQGGERVTQLEAIAEDAQRVYYANLDKRLAGLPVKSLLVTMMLMIGYFIVLLAPTSIQVKNVMMGG